MAKKPETLFKEHVLDFLKTLPRTWFVKIQQVALRGTPDVLCCIAGLFVALELKKSADAFADALQLHNLDLIYKAGGVSMLVYPENWESIREVLTKLSANKSHKGFSHVE